MEFMLKASVENPIGARVPGRPEGALAGPLLARWFATPLLVGVAFGAALIYAGGLDFPLHKDENQFWAQTQFFVDHWPPGFEQIRSYPEPMTPLSFLCWAMGEVVFGGGLPGARLLNVALGVAILAMIGLRVRNPSCQAALATLGLLLYPYFLPLALHLYTDIVAAFWVVLGLWLYARGRNGWCGLAFALAIATRQYMVAFPAGLVAAELAPSLLRLEFDAGRWRRVAPSIASGITLIPWMLLFEGLAPAAGLAEWPRHVISLERLAPGYGLYFVACIGAYFVVPELLLFRRWHLFAELRTRRSALLALAVVLLFIVFPPLSEARTHGALNRLAMLMLPPALLGDLSLVSRLLGFGVLAWLACVRFARFDLVFWLLLANATIMLAVFEPWEKYDLAMLVALWYLRSIDDLEQKIDLFGLVGSGGEASPDGGGAGA
jgi:hypothetical protein